MAFPRIGQSQGSGGGSGTPVIPERTTDPSSPTTNEAWVLRTDSPGAGPQEGNPIGPPPFLWLTYAESPPATSTYQFSYQTNAGSIVRVTLTP